MISRPEPDKNQFIYDHVVEILSWLGNNHKHIETRRKLTQ